MSNQFKSRNTRVENRKDLYRSQFRKENETPKKVYYEMNNEDFPELFPPLSLKTPSEVCDSNNELYNKQEESVKNSVVLDFKNASLKEVPNIEVSEKFKPGWLYMKYDKNNNIMRKNMNKNMENNPKELFENQVNNAINNIIEKHQEFIEYYGYDNYEKDYLIDNYLEMAEKYEEKNSDNDEDSYSDEYSDDE
jgi:hypothetical protein